MNDSALNSVKLSLLQFIDLITNETIHGNKSYLVQLSCDNKLGPYGPEVIWHVLSQEHNLVLVPIVVHMSKHMKFK